MARRNRAARTTEPVGDYVDQLRAGADWTDARVVMMPGEINRAALNTRRKQCPAIHWARTGMLTQRQAGALVIYADAFDDAGYGRTKSCLAEPTGNGNGAGQERQYAMRQRLARMRNACPDLVALMFTDAALFPFGRETLDDVSERMILASRGNRRDITLAYLVATAESVAAHIDGGER